MYVSNTATFQIAYFFFLILVHTATALKKSMQCCMQYAQRVQKQNSGHYFFLTTPDILD